MSILKIAFTTLIAMSLVSMHAIGSEKKQVQPDSLLSKNTMMNYVKENTGNWSFFERLLNSNQTEKEYLIDLCTPVNSPQCEVD